ncbi:hypothetical protein PHET_02240 [Paragonimus heterotremus]|uniref:Uncharacterized protein n=1 Tax=Paragonimus heterotremus TaxID=100268 RepID=A0A8J4SQP7_9TREM|nr:hypothetical protein PHET_02240 [Paragonimus heterotremus]
MKPAIFLVVSYLLVGLTVAVPRKFKYRLEYDVDPSNKLEKRLETERETLVHLKEAGKIDMDGEKRAHQFASYDHFDYDDDFYGDKYDDVQSRDVVHPQVEKLGLSQYQKKQAIRYEKRLEKQRELSQEIRHLPRFIKVESRDKYDNEYVYGSYGRGNKHASFDRYIDNHDYKFDRYDGPKDEYDEDDY